MAMRLLSKRPPEEVVNEIEEDQRRDEAAPKNLKIPESSLHLRYFFLSLR